MVEINSLGAQGANPVLPMGRIVSGHPMLFTQEKDWATKAPKVDKNGQPKMSAFFGCAIPQEGEQHWSQTQWGGLIAQEGASGFPRGESQRPDFAWKIVDGDSTIPNKNGTIPSTQEGYKGHWVMSISTSLSAPKCYKANAQFGTLTECVSDKEIKRGDYGRVSISVKANCDAQGFAQSPGVYLNPLGFCMDKEGQEIVGEGIPTVNPTAAFGGTVVQGVAVAQPMATPAYQAPIAQPMATPAYQAPVVPNTNFMNPPLPTPTPVERKVSYQGQICVVSDLLSGGWTEEMIDQHTTPVA